MFNTLTKKLMFAIGIAIAAILNLLPPSDVPEQLTGIARVVDGDGLRLAGEVVRLVGIDAPEARQECEKGGNTWPCGRESTRQLKNTINRQTVVCEVEGVDHYDRLLATCFNGGLNLNEWMVREGWAVSYGQYIGHERAAKKARKGLWQGTFQRPRDWRDEHLQGTVAANAS